MEKNAEHRTLELCLWTRYPRADKCETEKFDEGGHHARFQNLGLYSDCMKPGVRKCANEDHVKEAKLVQVWDEISGRTNSIQNWKFSIRFDSIRFSSISIRFAAKPNPMIRFRY